MYWQEDVVIDPEVLREFQAHLRLHQHLHWTGYSDVLDAEVRFDADHNRSPSNAAGKWYGGRPPEPWSPLPHPRTPSPLGAPPQRPPWRSDYDWMQPQVSWHSTDSDHVLATTWPEHGTGGGGGGGGGSDGGSDSGGGGGGGGGGSGGGGGGSGGGGGGGTSTYEVHQTWDCTIKMVTVSSPASPPATSSAASGLHEGAAAEILSRDRSAELGPTGSDAASAAVCRRARAANSATRRSNDNTDRMASPSRLSGRLSPPKSPTKVLVSSEEPSGNLAVRALDSTSAVRLPSAPPSPVPSSHSTKGMAATATAVASSPSSTRPLSTEPAKKTQTKAQQKKEARAKEALERKEQQQAKKEAQAKEALERKEQQQAKKEAQAKEALAKKAQAKREEAEAKAQAKKAQSMEAQAKREKAEAKKARAREEEEEPLPPSPPAAKEAPPKAPELPSHSTEGVVATATAAELPSSSPQHDSKQRTSSRIGSPLSTASVPAASSAMEVPQSSSVAAAVSAANALQESKRKEPSKLPPLSQPSQNDTRNPEAASGASAASTHALKSVTPLASEGAIMKTASQATTHSVTATATKESSAEKSDGDVKPPPVSKESVVSAAVPTDSASLQPLTSSGSAQNSKSPTPTSKAKSTEQGYRTPKNAREPSSSELPPQAAPKSPGKSNGTSSSHAVSEPIPHSPPSNLPTMPSQPAVSKPSNVEATGKLQSPPASGAAAISVISSAAAGSEQKTPTQEALSASLREVSGNSRATDTVAHVTTSVETPTAPSAPSSNAQTAAQSKILASNTAAERATTEKPPLTATHTTTLATSASGQKQHADLTAEAVISQDDNRPLDLYSPAPMDEMDIIDDKASLRASTRDPSRPVRAKKSPQSSKTEIASSTHDAAPSSGAHMKQQKQQTVVRTKQSVLQTEQQAVVKTKQSVQQEQQHEPLLQKQQQPALQEQQQQQPAVQKQQEQQQQLALHTQQSAVQEHQQLHQQHLKQTQHVHQQQQHSGTERPNSPDAFRQAGAAPEVDACAPKSSLLKTAPSSSEPASEASPSPASKSPPLPSQPLPTEDNSEQAAPSSTTEADKGSSRASTADLSGRKRERKPSKSSITSGDASSHNVTPPAVAQHQHQQVIHEQRQQVTHEQHQQVIHVQHQQQLLQHQSEHKQHEHQHKSPETVRTVGPERFHVSHDEECTAPRSRSEFSETVHLSSTSARETTTASRASPAMKSPPIPSRLTSALESSPGASPTDSTATGPSEDYADEDTLRSPIAQIEPYAVHQAASPASTEMMRDAHMRHALRTVASIKNDRQAAKTNGPLDRPKAFDWVCIKAHEAARHALHGAKVHVTSHGVGVTDARCLAHGLVDSALTLRMLATGNNSPLPSEVTRLVDLANELVSIAKPSELVYPDSNCTPSRAIKAEQADKAAAIARSIIDTCEDLAATVPAGCYETTKLIETTQNGASGTSNASKTWEQPDSRMLLQWLEQAEHTLQSSQHDDVEAQIRTDRELFWSLYKCRVAAELALKTYLAVARGVPLNNAECETLRKLLPDEVVDEVHPEYLLHAHVISIDDICKELSYFRAMVPEPELAEPHQRYQDSSIVRSVFASAKRLLDITRDTVLEYIRWPKRST